MAIDYPQLASGVLAARSLMSGAATAGARPAAIVASKAMLNVLQVGALASDANAQAALTSLQDFLFKNTTASDVQLKIGLSGELPFTFVAGTSYSCEANEAVNILKKAAANGTPFTQVNMAGYVATGVVQTFLG